MIEFMKSHYYDPYLAQYIQPKKEFKVKLKDGDKDFVFDATKADLNKFDKIIDEIGWKPKINQEKGLKKTLHWIQENIKSGDNTNNYTKNF